MPLDRLLLLLFTANLATFGSGRLMVPILENSLVQESGALTLDQFLFAFTVGRITPGPANLYVASIGWMLHGLPGALLAAAVVLLPGYLIIPLASGYRRLEGNGAVRGFGRGLIAASVGLLLASTIDIGRSALVSPVAAGRVRPDAVPAARPALAGPAVPRGGERRRPGPDPPPSGSGPELRRPPGRTPTGVRLRRGARGPLVGLQLVEERPPPPSGRGRPAPGPWPGPRRGSSREVSSRWGSRWPGRAGSSSV